MSETLSKRIKERRNYLKLSQEELAFSSGADQGQISLYERGRSSPSAETLGALAKSLHTTTDWLLGLTNDPDRPLRGYEDLDSFERELIGILRSKPNAGREKLLEIAKII